MKNALIHSTHEFDLKGGSNSAQLGDNINSPEAGHNSNHMLE